MPNNAQSCDLLFNFECSCMSCTEPVDDQSDERMSEIQQLIDEVPRVGFADRALQMSERVLSLMEQEGVSTPRVLALHVKGGAPPIHIIHVPAKESLQNNDNSNSRFSYRFNSVFTLFWC